MVHQHPNIIRRVWGYQRGNQNPYIEEQTTQWQKKIQKDNQRSTKHTYKTKDRVTRNPLEIWGELRCSRKVSSSCCSLGSAAGFLIRTQSATFFRIETFVSIRSDLCCMFKPSYASYCDLFRRGLGIVLHSRNKYVIFLYTGILSGVHTNKQQKYILSIKVTRYALRYCTLSIMYQIKSEIRTK
jgi:hypothetical protein